MIEIVAIIAGLTGAEILLAAAWYHVGYWRGHRNGWKEAASRVEQCDTVLMLQSRRPANSEQIHFN